MVLLTPRSCFCCEELDLVLKPDTHRCTFVSLSPSVVLYTILVTSLALSWLRPFRNEDFCGLRRSQSSLSALACCWLCSSYQLWVRSFPLWLLFLTSCRSALLPLAVGPLFPFFSVSTASAATSLTSTCLSPCSSSFHNCFARHLSVRYVSCNATELFRHCMAASLRYQRAVRSFTC